MATCHTEQVVASRLKTDLRPPRREDLRPLAWLALICAGAIVGSFFGAVVALLALVAARRYGPAIVLRAAFLTLVFAAIATVTTKWPNSLYDVRFAIDRPLAAGLAQAAAVLALVGVTIVAARTRWVPAPAATSSINGSSAREPDGSAEGKVDSWALRLGSMSVRGLIPLLALFGVLALIAVLASSAGHYVVDNHRELAWSPGHLL